MHKMYLFIVSVVFISLFSACDGSAAKPLTPAKIAVATRSPVSEPPRPTPTLNPLLATPRPLPSDVPLAAQAPDSASTLNVASTVSKHAIAASLSTTIDVLDWFNPGLPDPVPAGTILAIPRQYHAEQGETLTEIAKQLGLAVDLLSVVNPTLDANTPLHEGTLVAVPKLYTVLEESALETVATKLNVSMEALRAANLSLPSEAITVPANSVLVIPYPGSEMQP